MRDDLVDEFLARRRSVSAERGEPLRVDAWLHRCSFVACRRPLCRSRRRVAWVVRVVGTGCGVANGRDDLSDTVLGDLCVVVDVAAIASGEHEAARPVGVDDEPVLVNSVVASVAQPDQVVQIGSPGVASPPFDVVELEVRQTAARSGACTALPGEDRVALCARGKSVGAPDIEHVVG